MSIYNIFPVQAGSLPSPQGLLKRILRWISPKNFVKLPLAKTNRLALCHLNAHAAKF